MPDLETITQTIYEALPVEPGDLSTACERLLAVPMLFLPIIVSAFAHEKDQTLVLSEEDTSEKKKILAKLEEVARRIDLHQKILVSDQGYPAYQVIQIILNHLDHTPEEKETLNQLIAYEQLYDVKYMDPSKLTNLTEISHAFKTLIRRLPLDDCLDEAKKWETYDQIASTMTKVIERHPEYRDEIHEALAVLERHRTHISEAIDTLRVHKWRDDVAIKKVLKAMKTIVELTKTDPSQWEDLANIHKTVEGFISTHSASESEAIRDAMKVIDSALLSDDVAEMSQKLQQKLAPHPDEPIAPVPSSRKKKVQGAHRHFEKGQDPKSEAGSGKSPSPGSSLSDA